VKWNGNNIASMRRRLCRASLRKNIIKRPIMISFVRNLDNDDPPCASEYTVGERGMRAVLCSSCLARAGPYLCFILYYIIYIYIYI